MNLKLLLTNIGGLIMSYANNEKTRNEQLIDSDLFNKDGGRGSYRNDKNGQPIPHKHVLMDYKNNLYHSISDLVPNSFKWHAAKASTLSSQVACVNHLFPIRQNEAAILEMLNNINNIKVAPFDKVVSLFQNKNNKDVFVDFEVVDGKDNMNEGRHKTAIDAMIVAKKKNQTTYTLIILEWKYTESYGQKNDKSHEDRKNEKKGDNGLGKDRVNRYFSYLENPNYLNKVNKKDDCFSHVLFHEPFYQLMRQTIWAELFINGKISCKNIDPNIGVKDYLHLHIIPKGNEELLRNVKKYNLPSGVKGSGGLLDTWKSCLNTTGQNNYKILSPEELFKPLDNKRSLLEQSDCIKDPDDYIDYLRTRYWK